MNAQILEFPYARIRLEPERHDAKILRMPVKQQDLAYWAFLPMMFWMGVFKAD